MISLFFFALTLSTNPVKDTVFINERPSCGDCVLLIAGATSLRRADDPKQFAMFASVFYSPEGYFILGPVGKDNHIEVYDSKGTRKQIIAIPDAFGDEPMLPPQMHWVPGDTLHIIGTFPPYRHIVLNLQGRQVRSGTFPLPALAQVYYPNGSLVFSGAINTPAAIGHPFHFVDVNGKIQRSFGVGRQPFLTSISDRLNRPLALADSGRFWAAHPSGAVIEVWDTTGSKQRTFMRSVVATATQRFDSLGSQPGIDADTLPRPHVHQIAQREDQLWIFTAVPNTQWKPELSDEALIAQGRPVPSIEEELNEGPARRNTLIDVIDLKTNQLITSQTLSGAIIPIGSGYVATLRKDGNGHWTYVVGRLQISKESSLTPTVRPTRKPKY
jgi:hypothetical protein